jgi:hypothetical protein
LLEHELLSGMCRAMRQVEASMWTFVRVEGVEPTNNDAEREARHGVSYRKLSYRTQRHFRLSKDRCPNLHKALLRSAA